MLVEFGIKGNCSKPVFTFLFDVIWAMGTLGIIYESKLVWKNRFATADWFFAFRVFEKSLNSLRGRGFPWAWQPYFFQGGDPVGSPQNDPSKKSRKIIWTFFKPPWLGMFHLKRIAGKNTWTFFFTNKNQPTGRNLTYLEDPGISLYIDI